MQPRPRNTDSRLLSFLTFSLLASFAPAAVAEPVVVQPWASYVLGPTQAGLPIAQTFVVNNPVPDRDVAVLGFLAEAEGFAVEAPASSIPSGGTLELHVTLLASVPGEFILPVTIYIDLGPESEKDPLLRFEVRGVVETP